MAVATPTRDRLRTLAEFRPDRGRVLSLFLDLDPSEFAIADARATAINSLLDEAARRIDAAGLDHASLVQARADLDRVRTALDPASMGGGGARGVAVFVAGDELLEIIRVPQPLQRRFELGPAPVVAPLALAGTHERVHVALVSTGESRLFAGTADGLEEVADFADHIDKRVKEEERRDHFDSVAEALLDRADDYDTLLIGGPQDAHALFAERLHAYVREKLAGEVRVDIGGATPAAVLEAAEPVLARRRAERQKVLVDRFYTGLHRDDGLAVAGREEVGEMLEQRRVETLLVTAGLHDPAAVAAALVQDADVVVLADLPDLADGIGALLRF